jgi:competence protein ComGC
MEFFRFNKPGCIRGWLLLSMIQIVLIVSFLTIVLICSIAGMVKPEYKTTTAKLAAVFGVSSGVI